MTNKWETRNQSLIHDSFRKTEYYEAFETKPQLSHLLSEIGMGDKTQLAKIAKMLTDIYDGSYLEESDDMKKRDFSKIIVPASATYVLEFV